MAMADSILSQFLVVLLSAWAGATAVAALSMATRGSALFVSPYQFPLLSDRTRDEQDRLLRKAVALAFSGWRICLQGVPLAFFMALSFTLATRVPSLLSLHPSTWLTATIAGVTCGLGVIPATRLMVAYIAPFLHRVVTGESPNQAMQPTGSAGG
jgi:hypothetical protein